MQPNTYSPDTQNSLALKTNILSQTVGVAYIGSEYIDDIVGDGSNLSDYRIDIFGNLDEFNSYLSGSSITDIPYALLIEANDSSVIFEEVQRIRQNPLTSGTIIIILSAAGNSGLQQKALEAKANDIYFSPFSPQIIFERINFLIKFKFLKSHGPGRDFLKSEEYKMPVTKRLFDIAVSLFLVILLSPLFIVIAIIIRLESKGPVIYKSKRAGSGYKIFDFYKFRSMVVDADKKLEKLSKTNNQYAAGEDTGAQKAFVKILNDPRITKIGNILRKTSIDELPQLFNVLKGDMSIVGNRPLPLYEAEQLTSDQFAMRFLGPAGITGLWQISKRGQAEMSEDERKELDNTYAKNSSLWMDLKIMLKTIPAMLQKEKV